MPTPTKCRRLALKNALVLHPRTITYSYFAASATFLTSGFGMQLSLDFEFAHPPLPTNTLVFIQKMRPEESSEQKNERLEPPAAKDNSTRTVSVTIENYPSQQLSMDKISGGHRTGGASGATLILASAREKTASRRNDSGKTTVTYFSPFLSD
ncbi:hypothetical protein FIBSPDRAFT_883926 [Athelia psychrophila]|uniref:Uncharacterized protein n=1 Tax=Athelia psychrophila TaxID=1759441 RepID=A0A166TNF0_9AGAM|nr:hypothetical protein FIBSPDRAFT_883926 [Fibularhizoctonia sp. CBS 109695]